jgi:hypothetical protein
METGSSAEVVDVVMASVDGSIHRDDDYIEGVLFSDGSTRAELDECAVSLGLDPGDYEDKFHLRRALSAQLTQLSIDDRLAAATPYSEGTVTSATSSEYQVPQALAHVQGYIEERWGVENRLETFTDLGETVKYRVILY